MMQGLGGGIVVSILAFYSDDPSLNLAGYLNFLHENTKINKKVAGVGPTLNNFIMTHLVGCTTLLSSSGRTSGRRWRLWSRPSCRSRSGSL